MKDYKISIIVPVYNTEKYLEKCVDSLLNQTYCNLEILLIDDGSKDASGQLCDKYAKRDTRIQAVHKENGGLISAWKKGVEVSSGQYFCFVDSDDWIDDHMIEEMAEHLNGEEREIVASDYVIERDDGSKQFVWQELPPGEYLKEDMKEKVIPNLLGRENRYVTISRCMKLISKTLIVENQKYCNPATIMGEDATIMLPALIDCNRLFIMDHKAYYHYLHISESMAHRYDSRLYENIQLLVKTVQHIVKDKFSGNEQIQRLKQVDQEAVFWMFLVLKNEARGNKEGYRRNILTICRTREIQDLVRNTPVSICQSSNKLLYLVMRYPNHLTVSLLRGAMLWYYREKRR